MISRTKKTFVVLFFMTMASSRSFRKQLNIERQFLMLSKNKSVDCSSNPRKYARFCKLTRLNVRNLNKTVSGIGNKIFFNKSQIAAPKKKPDFATYFQKKFQLKSSKKISRKFFASQICTNFPTTKTQTMKSTAKMFNFTFKARFSN
jgi:hypothetical protein